MCETKSHDSSFLLLVRAHFAALATLLPFIRKCDPLNDRAANLYSNPPRTQVNPSASPTRALPLSTTQVCPIADLITMPA